MLVAQDFLVTQQNALAASRGETALALIAIYKALGGGWEPWRGQPALSTETVEEMQARTRWGRLLSEHDRAAELDAARTGTENDRGWWRWRWWAPRW